MTNLCTFKEYQHIFGRPREGVHSYRIANDTAGIDYILTILGSIWLSRMTKIPLTLMTIGLLVLSIILHILFGVPTQTTKYLGIKC